MLWNLDIGWFVMAFGTVAGVAYILALMMESSLGKEGYGPLLNAAFTTAGFFLAILGANYQGINLAELKWALAYGGAGAFAMMLLMLVLRGGGAPLIDRNKSRPAWFPSEKRGRTEPMSYVRFAAMIATSTVVMLGLMYLNTYSLQHVLWSETRFYMALLMGAAMAIVMMAFMFAMYARTGVNVAIMLAALVVFGASLYLVRSQATVGDVAWMKAMIPHHSIAILTSERANITDPRVRDLADRIITAQREEIDEMKSLIGDLEAR